MGKPYKLLTTSSRKYRKRNLCSVLGIERELTWLGEGCKPTQLLSVASVFYTPRPAAASIPQFPETSWSLRGLVREGVGEEDKARQRKKRGF